MCLDINKNSGCFSRGSAKILGMLSSPAIDGNDPPSAETGIASTRPPNPRPSTVTIVGDLLLDGHDERRGIARRPVEAGRCKASIAEEHQHRR